VADIGRCDSGDYGKLILISEVFESRIRNDEQENRSDVDSLYLGDAGVVR